MHQLIVLGNGFDLECGLKSRFSDFFGYRNENSSGSSGSKQQSSSGQVFDPAHSTVWDAILSSSKEDKWQDVEQAIYDFLARRLGKGKNSTAASIQYWNLLRAPIPSREDDSEDPFSPSNTKGESFRVVRDFLTNYYEKHETKKIEIPQYYSMLLEQLHRLEREFGEYLREQCQNNQKYEDRSKRLLEFLSKDELLLLKPEASLPDTSVLDFNYTNPASRYVKEHNIHLINIHGNTNNPIFGIDGKDLMDNPNLVQFTKTYRLLALNNPDRNKIIHTSTDNSGKPTGLIKFYGHSLGGADYSYFQAIFDGVDLYQSHTRLVFYYKPTMDGAQEDMFRKVTRLINTYGKTLDNKDHGKNLMHKLLLGGRLSIKPFTYHDEND